MLRGSLVALVLLAGCAEAAKTPPPPPPVTVAPLASSTPPAASAVPEPDDRAVLLARMTKKLERTLLRVSEKRGLPIKKEVKLEVLDRPAILAHMKKKAAVDLPPELVKDQGEVLVALELIEPDYDFEKEAFDLQKDAIAGFYDPDTKAMYLASDLGDSSADETLNHELVHALQDQSFDLVGRLKYKKLEGDRTGAFHALAEGDATIAMFDVVDQNVDGVSVDKFRSLLRGSMRLQMFGKGVPFVLRESLIAPYVDGFGFVKGLRARGGWAEVDKAFKKPPTTTEQLLHLDKYDKGEAAVAIGELPHKAFADWTLAVEDVFGEQGVRILFADKAKDEDAEKAAAGWGGDRYAMLEKKLADGRALVVGWKVVFDTPADAREAAKLFGERWGKTCTQRKDHGAITWKTQGSSIAVVSGPFTRKDKAIKPGPGGCKEANAWAAEILKAK